MHLTVTEGLHGDKTVFTGTFKPVEGANAKKGDVGSTFGVLATVNEVMVAISSEANS